jgi:hypothetical protein
MKSSVLGYGGALVLVAVALAILVDTAVSGGQNAEPRAPAAARGSKSPTVPIVHPAPSDPPASQGQAAPALPTQPDASAAPAAPAGGTEPCPAGSARYQRFGDTVKVSVQFPGSGYVAAFVEVTGQDAMTKSATNTGRPLTFEFAGVPRGTTERIGVTVITEAGLRTCDVRERK